MRLLKLSLLVTFTLFASLSFAEVPTPPIEGYDWLTPVIEFLKGVPKVGDVLVKAFSVMALIATISTSLVAVLKTLFVTMKQVAKWSGADKALEYLDKYEKKLLPWFAYLSMFNVQKKKF